MNLDDCRDLLVAWANLNSGSDHPAGLDRMSAALQARFSELPGAAVDALALAGTSAHVVRVRMRPEAPERVLLCGHYDTVFGAEHAFQRCEQRDATTLRGPGVADMKGGIVAMLAALTAFERSAEAPRLGWEVLLGPDEEIGSPWSRPVWEDAARRHRLALVFEPARENGHLVRARKGTGIFKIACHGRAAHAGRDPGAGRNAIIALAELLPRVDAMNAELPGVMVNVGHIAGGGAVNIVPDFAEAAVNVRIARAEDAARVGARLRALTAAITAREGYRAEISGGFNRPPKQVTAREERLFAAWRGCGRELGVTLDWQDVDGGSDGNLLAAAGLPTLDGLGPRGGRLHSAEEYVDLDSLKERAAVAELFLRRLARGEIALDP